MGIKFTAGRIAISVCDRCGFQYRLSKLRVIVVRTKPTNIMVCPTCWEADHPQNMQGMYPVADPQAIRNPRPDTTYLVSGLNTLGHLSGGSREIQWGWAPVGGGNPAFTPNDLVAVGQIGVVEVTIT